MATPPHGFRAHDCGSLRARESRETSHGVGEPGRLHVVGIAAKCGIPPGRVARTRSRLPSSAEVGEVLVGYAFGAQSRSEPCLVKVRIPSRARQGADICKSFDLLRSQRVDELRERPRRMPNRPSGHWTSSA